MEVTSIQDGIIIDHVPAGTALKVLEYLSINPASTKLALIMNTDSHRYGTKDIIPIEDPDTAIDLDVLGLVARSATVDVIHGGRIVDNPDGNIIAHGPAGTALKVLEYLSINPVSTKLALIMITDSHRYGTKDIIKIEDPDTAIDLDVLGLVARSATVDVIHGGRIVDKMTPTLPERVVNVITGVNPRCVTTTEPGIDQVFYLDRTDGEAYRCRYCDEEAEF